MQKYKHATHIRSSQYYWAINLLICCGSCYTDLPPKVSLHTNLECRYLPAVCLTLLPIKRYSFFLQLLLYLRSLAPFHLRILGFSTVDKLFSRLLWHEKVEGPPLLWGLDGNNVPKSPTNGETNPSKPSIL
jgi:hypothetical protein